MRYSYLIFMLALLTACNFSKEKKEVTPTQPRTSLELTLAQVNRLVHLPMDCVNTEYPNKLNQTIASGKDLQAPSSLHPAFYGCFDWHSSVHGHWSLVSLLKQFPNLEKASEVKEKLRANMSKQNILTEVAYFQPKHNASYERTYGWAWFLKLVEEIHTWDDPLARELEQNLQPLTDLIVKKYIKFLPKLNYPIRVGEHTNTAFGLTFAWDYAVTVGDMTLKNSIEKSANDFYLKDADCPITWEPSGFDFLSPCLQEAAIMKRVLPTVEFKTWLSSFLPQLKNQDFKLPFGEVSDRSDGKLVHLDGVNFSRAWSLYKIAEGLPEYEHLKIIADAHINYSLPNIVSDSYAGGHWLGSFAIYSLNATNND